MHGVLEQGRVNTVMFFHSLWNHPFLDALMILVSKFGLMVSGAAFVVAMIRKRRAIGLLYWAAAGAAVSVALDLIGGHLFEHPRPFVALQIQPLFPHGIDNSFPSDHSAVAAFLAAILLFVDVPAAAVASAAALALGIARVYCLVHWPVDIVGGWLIGAAPAIGASLLWRARNGSFAHHNGVRA